MKDDIVLTIIGLVLALSGWAKVIFDYITSHPKIRGRVFDLIIGEMADPQRKGEFLTAFIPYLYLVNRRKNSVHILDYEMEVKVDRKWIRVKRVYGLHNLKNSFSTLNGEYLKINHFEENLIYKKATPAEYGQPLHGWLGFAGPDSLRQKEVKAYRVTCIDAFQGKHRIVTKPKDFANLYLLQEIADLEIPNDPEGRMPSNTGHRQKRFHR
jgi:hypothetical protein